MFYRYTYFTANLIPFWPFIIIQSTSMPKARPHWRYDKPCPRSHLLCFHEMLFKECDCQHEPKSLTAMYNRWGDMRHKIRRELQAEGYKQSYPGCQYGINCIFLFRGLCRDKHSSFDQEWASRLRKELLKTKCLNGDDCQDNLCFYFHETKSSKLVKENGKLMNKLLKDEKKERPAGF